MNRSLANVLFGAFGKVAQARRRGGRRGRRHGARDDAPRTSRSCSPTRSAVVIVPGYGLAVAQAQHDGARARRPAREEGRRRQVRDPSRRGPDARPHERAARRGERAVRPAQGDGRDQPGVPADRRRARDRRERRRRTRRRATNPGSPIYGMPILDVDKAKHDRRAQALDEPGLRRHRQRAFYDPKTAMLFGDAKESVAKLVRRVKALERRASRRNAPQGYACPFCAIVRVRGQTRRGRFRKTSCCATNDATALDQRPLVGEQRGRSRRSFRTSTSRTSTRSRASRAATGTKPRDVSRSR